jgi:hypothetical protein
MMSKGLQFSMTILKLFNLSFVIKEGIPEINGIHCAQMLAMSLNLALATVEVMAGKIVCLIAEMAFVFAPRISPVLS